MACGFETGQSGQTKGSAMATREKKPATYTNHDILGRAKQPVQTGTGKGGVQAKGGVQLGEGGICQCLGNDDEADGDA